MEFKLDNRIKILCQEIIAGLDKNSDILPSQHLTINDLGGLLTNSSALGDLLLILD